MIVVRVLVQVKPENKTSFVDLMKNDVTTTQDFDGCVHFEVYQDIKSDDTFVLYEEWENQTKFDAYRNSDYFKELGGQIFPLLEGSPNSAYYDASLIAS